MNKYLKVNAGVISLSCCLFVSCGPDRNGVASAPVKQIVVKSESVEAQKMSDSDTVAVDSTDTIEPAKTPRTKWYCGKNIIDECHRMLVSHSFDEAAFKERCPSCAKLTERVIGTPSEEAFRKPDGEEIVVTEKYEQIGSAEFSSLIELFELCHKGNVNCQEYYMDGVLNLRPYGRDVSAELADYTDYQKPVNPEFTDWRYAPMIVLRMFNNLVDGVEFEKLTGATPCPECKEKWKRRTNYKLFFRKILWKYDYIQWDRFRYSNPHVPRGTTIILPKHSLLANADQIELIYDPDNLLKPAMRIYPEELAAEEDAKGIVWNDDVIKKSGLKSVRLIDATAAILNDMEKNPYINKPAP